MKTIRITCIILCLFMVFALLPVTAFAYTPTVVLVGGTDVSGGGYWLNNAGGIIEGGSEDGYNVHFDSAQRILTLNSADITANYTIGTISAAIYTNRDLTIRLENDSSVRGAACSTDAVAQSYGVCCADALSITGSGKLTATGGSVETTGSDPSESCGVYGGSISITSGKLDAVGGEVSNGSSYGLFGVSESIAIEDGAVISIEGGTVTATGGKATLNYGVCGKSISISGGTVDATGSKATGSSPSIRFGMYGDSITIEDGTVTATGGDISSGLSSGIYGSGITVEGGTVNAIGGNAASGFSYGVYGTAVTIKGGTVTADGGNSENGKSYGVFSDDAVTVEGGNVTATGGEVGGTNCSSHGIHGATSIGITGGTVNANGGKATNGYSYGLFGGSVAIADGTVTADGSETSGTNCSSIGIYGSDTVEITDSTVNAGSSTAFGSNPSTSMGMYGISVTIEGSTVTAVSKAVTSGSSYGVFSNYVDISGSNIKASGDTANYSCGLFSYIDLFIEDCTVTAVGGEAIDYEPQDDEIMTAFSNGVYGHNVIISGGRVYAAGGEANGENCLSNGLRGGSSIKINGGTMLIKGSSYAIHMADEVTLDILSDYTAPHTVTVSENLNGLPASAPGSRLDSYKYLRIAPGEATVSDVKVVGTVYSVITEANATVALMNKRFCAMNEGADVSAWFCNLPAGLVAKIYSQVAENSSHATVVFSGTPTAASTAAMAINIPSDKLLNTGEAAVTFNENARWDIPEPVTVYNNPSRSAATIWLTGGSELDSNDLLITERDPSGSKFDALRKLANRRDVFCSYDIHLRSSSIKHTDSPMHLSFDLSDQNGGQAFTLVHQKADGAYEYFYDAADANGDLTFGPLYELSPFLLVKGTLEPGAEIDDDIPLAGDSSQPVLWLAVALTAAAALLAGLLLRRRQGE